jgi:hypothetical protein
LVRWGALGDGQYLRRSGNVIAGVTAAEPSGGGDMSTAVYDPDQDGKVAAAAVADVTPWAGVSEKPSTFPPDGHQASHVSGLDQIATFGAAARGLVPASGGGTSTFLRADGTFAAPPGGAGAWTTVKKTADEPRTNNTLAADAALQIVLAPATRYTIRGRAYLLVQNASADARYDLTYSGSWTTVYCLDRRNAAGVAAGTDNQTARIAAALPGTTDVTATATGIVIVEFELTGLTNLGGTLAFRFAQVTTNASATVGKAGGYLESMVVA